MQCDITNGLPFPDEHFDVVVSSEVFEHIESKNYPFIMSEIYRVLSPKGRAVLGFPMNTLNKQFHSVEKELKSLGHVDFPVHETFIDTGTNAGFDFINYDSSFATSSSWRIPKETKDSKEYKTLRRTLGAAVTRSIMMILSEDHTGGGFYTFDKPKND
jgi:SAM-dependent methyltransferase